MKNFIAVFIALVVVGLAFFTDAIVPKIQVPDDQEGTKGQAISLNFPRLNLPGITTQSSGEDAYDTFEQYREYARTSNLEGLKSLSHQISPTCSDSAKIAECNNLMENVYFFTKAFKREDFKYAYEDERQIVLTTDFMQLPDMQEGAEPVKFVLLFTKENNEPKMLGLKFCLPDETNPQECFETDPAKRDLDNNGWWDQVEALFYK